MAVGDMRGLVGNHGAQHVGAVRAQDQARVNEDMLVIDHESIQRAVLDHQNTHAAAQSCRRQNRRGQLLQRIFNIGITHQGGGAGGQGGDNQENTNQTAQNGPVSATGNQA